MSAEQLDIQLHLCANCGRAIAQPKTGRRRRTCGDRCRQELSRKRRFDSAVHQARVDVSRKARRSLAPPPHPASVTKPAAASPAARRFVTRKVAERRLLAAIGEQPGITVPELGDRFGVRQNFLYRVLPALMQEGKICKRGRGWFLAG
jgi:hypothetical protein